MSKFIPVSIPHDAMLKGKNAVQTALAEYMPPGLKAMIMNI